MSMEGINESIHSLGGIEEIPSKIGVFSRMQKLQFENTRDYRGFSTRLDGLESTQGVTKSSRTSQSSRPQESRKENRIHSKQSTKRTRLTRIQKPGGHKKDWASFPTQSQYKVFQKSIPKVLILERRGGRRTEKGDDGEEAGGHWPSVRREAKGSPGERGKGSIYSTHAGV